MQYLTEDAQAQSLTKNLLWVIDSYFSRGFQIVNLQTGTVIGEDHTYEADTKSYSNNLSYSCLERPKQYLYVGDGRMPDSPAAVEDSVFFGTRPL